MRPFGAPLLSLGHITALVAAVGVAGCGGDDAKNDAAAAPAATTAAASGAAGGAIDVALTEYAIKPAADTTPAGEVTFDVSNDGAIPHEFVVVKTDTKAGDLLQGAEADETGTVGELDEKALGVKARKTLTLDLKAGHYALICNLPGHYQGGMHTDFTVE
jgi:uncharacterized cupredoxin-like copper-binding protein